MNKVDDFNLLDKEIDRETMEVLLKPYKLLDMSDEFKFNCIQCGECCRNMKDRPVIITGIELFKIHKELGIEPKEIIDRFCDIEHIRNLRIPALKLKLQEDDSCIFLEGNKCLIHNAKPHNCLLMPIVKTLGYKYQYEYYYLNKEKCKNIRNSTTIIKLEDWLKQTDFWEYNEDEKRYINLWTEMCCYMERKIWQLRNRAKEKFVETCFEGLYLHFNKDTLKESLDDSIEFLESHLSGFEFQDN